MSWASQWLSGLTQPLAVFVFWQAAKYGEAWPAVVAADATAAPVAEQDSQEVGQTCSLHSVMLNQVLWCLLAGVFTLVLKAVPSTLSSPESTLAC